MTAGAGIFIATANNAQDPPALDPALAKRFSGVAAFRPFDSAARKEVVMRLLEKQGAVPPAAREAVADALLAAHDGDKGMRQMKKAVEKLAGQPFESVEQALAAAVPGYAGNASRREGGRLADNFISGTRTPQHVMRPPRLARGKRAP